MPSTVMPAQAGIQLEQGSWTPAYAGVTVKGSGD
jgi:hypothetical protein